MRVEHPHYDAPQHGLGVQLQIRYTHDKRGLRDMQSSERGICGIAVGSLRYVDLMVFSSITAELPPILPKPAGRLLYRSSTSRLRT